MRGAPDATVMAFGDDGTGAVDTFALGDELAERGGWFFDRQTPPDSLHATVHAGHLADHRRAVRRPQRRPSPNWPAPASRAADGGTAYGTV